MSPTHAKLYTSKVNNDFSRRGANEGRAAQMRPAHASSPLSVDRTSVEAATKRRRHSIGRLARTHHAPKRPVCGQPMPWAEHHAVVDVARACFRPRGLRRDADTRNRHIGTFVLR